MAGLRTGSLTAPATAPDTSGAAASRGFGRILAVVCALLLAAAIAGHVTGLARPHGYYLFAVPAVTFTLPGGLMVRHRPRNPIGWLFVAIGLSSAGVVVSASFAGPAGFWLMARLEQWVFAVPVGLLPVALLLFPDGRLPSRRWRPVMWMLGTGLGVMLTFLALAIVEDPNTLVNPEAALVGHARTKLWVATVGLAVVFMSMVAVFGSLVQRWRHARGDTRQQLKWLALGAAFVPVGIALDFFGEAPWGWVIVWTTVPAAAAVAILKHRLYDIDLFLNRSLVYATLTLVVVGAYAGIVQALSAVVASAGQVPGLVAAGIIAVVFGPLRERIQRGANRLLYGDRDDPYTVVSRLGRRLEQAVEPAGVLPRVVQTVADALQLPYAAIELAEGGETRLVESHGRRVAEPQAFPMTYQGQVVGRLLVTPRSPSRPFTPVERRLLDDLARQAGLAAHAVRLTADLQRSRERLVRSREEERRRLRRDLHDGLGPTLAGMTMQVGAARVAEGDNPLLSTLEQQLRNCSMEVRRLVDDLRPPALDQLGLVGAIRDQVEAFTAGSPLEIAISAPEHLGELPAAVEVAAYRIAAESVTNTVRHASASRCDICLTVNGNLVIEITDDGAGLPDHCPAGVGLASMRERAAELGGDFLAQRLPTGGTRIRAELPL
ncbi:MAG: histidine kinase [Egibacteraceae bacterium]